MDENSRRLRQYSNRNRRLFMQALGVAGVGLTAGSVIASDHDEDETDEEDDRDDDGENATEESGRTQIDSCTIIDEPGEYELVADLGDEEVDQMACIVIQSEGVTLHGNGHTIDGSGFDSCIAVSSEFRFLYVEFNPVIRDVVVRGSKSGILAITSGFQAEYTDITAVENDAGFRFYISGGTIANCVAENNDVGISLEGDDGVLFDGGRVDVENSTLRLNEKWGLGIGRMSGARFSGSRIVQNGIGVKSHSTAVGAVFEECHICRNEHYGVDSASQPGDDPDLHDDDRDFPLDPRLEGLIMAVDNYWGAPNGPSSFGNPQEPFTDPETGRPADGDGDAISQGIEAGVSNVRFDPFHETAVEDVGADL